MTLETDVVPPTGSGFDPSPRPPAGASASVVASAFDADSHVGGYSRSPADILRVVVLASPRCWCSRSRAGVAMRSRGSNRTSSRWLGS